MKIVLLSFLLCFYFSAQAQDSLAYRVHRAGSLKYAKGTWLVGLQAGHSPSELIGYNLTTHLYGGYFVADKLLLGLLVTRIQEGITQPLYDISYLAGPILRYQLTRSRISPFLMIACQMGRRTLTQDESSATTSGIFIVDPGPRLVYSRSAGIGVSIRTVASLRLDVEINWQDRVSTIDAGLSEFSGLYQAQFGLNYSLGH